MDYNSVRHHLRQAEFELLGLINPADQIKNYDEMQACLDLARAINAILERIPSNEDHTTITINSNSIEEVKPERPEASLTKKQVEKRRAAISSSKADSDELPCYFAYQGKMFKVGQSRGDNGELYKKSMPLEDVLTVSSVVESLLDAQPSLSVTDVMQALRNELPIYKVNLTLGVLTQMGVLMAQGRGRYMYTENPKGPAGRWVDAIQEYPQKLYLLDEIADQRKG